MDLRNPMSKAVPGKFHVSGEHSKCNCLQKPDQFPQVSCLADCPIFNTVDGCNDAIAESWTSED